MNRTVTQKDHDDGEGDALTRILTLTLTLALALTLTLTLTLALPLPLALPGSVTGYPQPQGRTATRRPHGRRGCLFLWCGWTPFLGGVRVLVLVLVLGVSVRV